MKVLAIRGRNLASLADEFVIDLEHGALGGAGLYAITGPVGAGKSTLLDALCLALYDRTPRLRQGGVRVGRKGEADEERLRDQDVRSVLRRGTADGFAEVDFVGRGGVRCRARWSVRRSRGQLAGRLQKQTLELIELDTGRSIGANKTEVLAAIEERVGLSFDQFRRSVLLAQGDFAAFLFADAKERAALLERMTGSDLYGRLSIAAHERGRQEAQRLVALRERQQEHEVLPSHERKQLLEARAASEQLLRQRQRQLEQLRAAQAWQELEAACLRDVAAAEEALLRVQAKRRAAAAAQAAGARSFAERLATARDELAGAVTAAHERERVARRWLEQHKGLEELALAWPRWQRLLGQLGETVSELQGAAATCRDSAARLEALGRRRAEDMRRRDELAAALEEQEQERTVAAERLVAARPDWWRERQRDVHGERFLLQKIDHRLAAADRAEQEVQRTREQVEQAARATDTARAVIEAAGKTLGPLKVRQAEADRAWRHAQQARSLGDHRRELAAGEPCPLCGATEHPYEDGGGSARGLVETDLGERAMELRAEVSRAETRITVAQTDLQHQLQVAAAAQEELAAHEQTVATVRADATTLRSQMAECLRTHAADRRQLAARLSVLDRELHDIQAGEAVVQELTAKLEQVDRRIANTRHQWQAADGVLQEGERERRAGEPDLARAQKHAAQLEARRDHVLAELGEALRSRGHGWQDKVQADPEVFTAALAREVDTWRTHEQTAETMAGELVTLARARSWLDQLQSGGGEDSEPEVASLQAACQVLDDDGATPHERIRGVRKLLDDEVARRQRQAQMFRELDDGCRQAEAVLEERARRLAEHREQRPTAVESADSEQANVQLQEVQVQEAQVQEAQARGEELRVKLGLDDQARQAVAGLLPKIEAQLEVCRVWRSLSELIGSHDGSRFRVFAQSLTLDVLLESANRHLAELAPRYRLMRVPGHDLDLQIVDLDMGEEVRGVHTLSGGETFLVSLALALALAALSARQTPVESLFIDEGMGTLDPQALDLALSSLDALQAGGRQVGLISHVAGMAERIGVQVRVSPVGGGRSRIEVTSAF